MSRDSRGPRRSEMDWRPPGWTYFPKRGLDRWLDDLFFAFCEVMVLGIPASLALVMVSDSGATLAALVVVITLTPSIALVRGERTRLSAVWPGFRPSTILARIVWYNATLAVAAAIGVAFDSSLAVSLGAVGVAVAVSIGAVVTLPWVAARATELLSWWTWGRPPD